MRQLELPFDCIKNVQELRAKHLDDQMHIPIVNLLELAEELYIRNSAQIVTGIHDVEDLLFIQQQLAGRMISSVSVELRQRFMLLLAILTRWHPHKKILS